VRCSETKVTYSDKDPERWKDGRKVTVTAKYIYIYIVVPWWFYLDLLVCIITREQAQNDMEQISPNGRVVMK
jgi:hypothetical protein